MVHHLLDEEGHFANCALGHGDGRAEVPHLERRDVVRDVLQHLGRAHPVQELQTQALADSGFGVPRYKIRSPDFNMKA